MLHVGKWSETVISTYLRQLALFQAVAVAPGPCLCVTTHQASQTRPRWDDCSKFPPRDFILSSLWNEYGGQRTLGWRRAEEKKMCMCMGFAKTGEGWTWGDVFPSTDLSATQPVHICIQN